MTPVYLVGVDGSNCSNRAIEYAKERALAANGKVLVAYVIEWSRYSFSTVEENEQRPLHSHNVRAYEDEEF